MPNLKEIETNYTDLAPIVLFVYNRPEHTLKTLDALASNNLAKYSKLYIYCDGYKAEHEYTPDINISKVRKIVKKENRFEKVTVIENYSNHGLASSIIKGVSDLVYKYGKVIVLEDDIVTTKGFLSYMNNALKMYNTETKVGCIHGWNFNLDTSNHHLSTFFLRGADCWGWATWDRAWSKFNPNGQELLNEIIIRNLKYQFNRRGNQDFFNMLKDQIEGKNDSWAVRWHASLFLQNMYCLHPTNALAINIGLDNSGIHCGTIDIEQSTVQEINLDKIDIVESEWFFKAFKKYSKNDKFYLKIWPRIKKLLKF